MAESARRDDQDVAERQDHEPDAGDLATDEQSANEAGAPDSGGTSEAKAEPQAETDREARADAVAEAGQDAENADHESDGDTDTDTGDAEDEDEADGDATDEADDAAETDEEPQEQLHADTLIARYRLLSGPTGCMLPWSWSDLPPAETDALVEVIDAFVESYNGLWALTESDTVPPCWHHHPALAHDLAALAWTYFQAYRDAKATPELALGFQAHLPGFRERMDYWLGADPAACRDGRHSRSWRPRTAPAARNPRDSAEERDAVILLGADDLGFPRERAAGALDH